METSILNNRASMKTKIGERSIKTEKCIDKPKRALSAYNFFFKEEREKILRLTSPPSSKPRRSHGKIGFADLARTVAEKWKSLDQETMRLYEIKAAEDKFRYEREIEACNRDRLTKLKCKSESNPKMPKVNADSIGSFNSSHSKFSLLHTSSFYSAREVTDSSSCEGDDISAIDDRDYSFCFFGPTRADETLSYSIQDCEPMMNQGFWTFDVWASSFDDESLNLIRSFIK
jgi:HMG-box domain